MNQYLKAFLDYYRMSVREIIENINPVPVLFADTKHKMIMKYWNGEPYTSGCSTCSFVCVEKGQTVRVIVASRFGWLGITEDLNKTHGYGAQVEIDELENYRDTIEVKNENNLAASETKDS